jgi:hypothetical protein
MRKIVPDPPLHSGLKLPVAASTYGTDRFIHIKERQNDQG